MISSIPYRHQQQGVMLLEALIAILIFSIGILAIIGMQANAIKLAGDSKYRSQAGLLANQLIGEMWIAQSSPTFATDFSSPNGARYLAWQSSVAETLPITGVSAPTVTITPSTIAAASSVSSAVDIEIFWSLPGTNNSGSPSHKYNTRTQINN